jgi:hypothetical protein
VLFLHQTIQLTEIGFATFLIVVYTLTWFSVNRIYILSRSSFWPLSWARSIQSIPPHPISLRSILILSSHLRLGLPSGICNRRMWTNFWYLNGSLPLFLDLVVVSRMYSGFDWVPCLI